MATIYVTVGISASGKSTFCREHAQSNDLILDSDVLREELFGDPCEQKNPSLVFDTMFKRTVAALEQNRNVWYCATNLIMKNRLHFIRSVRAKYPETKVICYLFSISPEICVQRNQLRARQVPLFVLLRQVQQFEMPVEKEGWNSIKVIDMMSDEEVEDFSQKIQNLVQNFGSQENHHHRNSLWEHCVICRNAAASRTDLPRQHQEAAVHRRPARRVERHGVTRRTGETCQRRTSYPARRRDLA